MSAEDTPVSVAAAAAAGAPTLADRSAGRAGILWMVLTTLLFVTQDATTRILAQTYPLTEVVWARFAVHMLLAGLIVASRSPHLMRSRRLPLQLLRSCLLLTTTLLTTLSLHLIPFAEVQAIATAAPVLVTALSVPLLGETVGWRRWTGVLGGLAGALLIVGPASGTFHWAVALPLCAALCNALYQIATRKLKTSDSPTTTIFYTGLAGTVVCTLALPFNWVTPDLTGIALMLLLGTLGGISHFCLIRAYSAAPASTVAPFGYTTLVWAALYSLMLFGETLRLSTMAGTAIIVASGVYIFYREQLRSTPAA
ncbi:DMT family transporter [Azospirillum picis]|uniref:Drug/metabolite transporter (DMT)-like permease n=1 Tax=Azospirillum picis TaxID=488438 RepID=A0ABU0MF74_9PROT|nr:DMT family transporter [Azospirillum picis]MBP2298256.1 drug/metabolite transporter (DMT)-like permease [Azospirillum picis]MDQ0532093.1 drug/metabolite transporter (DMT)-like permease [Azospirillum picis]